MGESEGVENSIDPASSTTPPLRKFKRLKAPVTKEKPQRRRPRKPPTLKKELGDNRFDYRTRNGRKHVCDACCELYTYQSQARPFDGQWIHPFPLKKRTEELYSMYANGDHDFTWVCTTCLFEQSGYTDIEVFRKTLDIDFTEDRQERTTDRPKKKKKKRNKGKKAK